jgi:hypothetical protein
MADEEHIDLCGINIKHLTPYVTLILVWRIMQKYDGHGEQSLQQPLLEWVVGQTKSYQINVTNLTSR